MDRKYNENRMSENIELKYDIYQPFGPSILRTTLPQQFVNLLNAEADRILHDEKLSKEHDWSHNLAGNVKQEVAILPTNIPNFCEFLAAMSKQYFINTIKSDPVENSKVSFRAWIVSQYAGDFNPMHIHDSNLSGVAFLKVPPKFDEESDSFASLHLLILSYINSFHWRIKCKMYIKCKRTSLTF